MSETQWRLLIVLVLFRSKNEWILLEPIIWPIAMNFRWLFLERCNRLGLVGGDMSTRRGHRYMFVIFVYKLSEMLQPLTIIDWWELRFGIVLHQLIKWSLRQNIKCIQDSKFKKISTHIQVLPAKTQVLKQLSSPISAPTPVPKNEWR